MSSSLRALAIFATCALTVSLSGCAPRGPVYIDRDATYTTTSTASVLAVADTDDVANDKVSDARRLRHDALASLRSSGAGQARAADLITRVFPSDTRGVPVYVERADVSGVESILIVEAIGPAKGRLSDKRLWVLDTDGNVLFSATR